MDERTKILDILAIAVPPDTPVTVSSEAKILEILGIVSNPQLVAAMQLVATMVPESTLATVQGLIQLLVGLMKINEKATSAHYVTMDSLLLQLEGMEDEELTFGTFLPICQKLIESSVKRQTVHKKSLD